MQYSKDIKAMTNDLSDGVQLAKKNAKYDDRLDAVGIDVLIDMISMGAELSSKSDGSGILDILRIPELRFNTWLSNQSIEDQSQFMYCVQIAATRVKNDIIKKACDVIDEYDTMLGKLKDGKGYGKSDRMRLEILKSKHKAAVDTLKQLGHDQDSGKNKNPMLGLPENKDDKPALPKKVAKVTMNDELKEKLERMGRN